jgi:photosystem II stability/assembly factor-like uncharacterized protein
MKKHLLFLFLLISTHSTHLVAQRWVASPTSFNLLPSKYNVYGIKMVDKDVIWATASLTYFTSLPTNHIIKVLLTTNGGQTWRVMNVNAAIGREAFDIQAFDSTTAWITTSNTINSEANGLFKTTDGGQTWTQKLANSAGNLWLRFLDKNNGVCLGFRSHSFAYTSDGGENWTIDSTSFAFMGTEVPSAFYSGTNSLIAKGDTLWFGTTAARIFRSTNKGRNWTPYATGIPPRWVIASVAFSDARNGMLVAIDSTTYKYAGLAKTGDGGITWQIVPMTALPTAFRTTPVLTTIPHKNGKVYLLSVENNTSSLGESLITPDNGDSWNNIGKDIHSHGASEFINFKIGWMGTGLINGTQSLSALFKWEDDGAFTPTIELYDNAFFSISPNPTQDVLTLQFEDASNWNAFNVEIADVTGRILFQTKMTDKQLIVNHLQSGIYFLKVKTKDKMGVIKFVKN